MYIRYYILLKSRRRFLKRKKIKSQKLKIFVFHWLDLNKEIEKFRKAKFQVKTGKKYVWKISFS